MAEYMARAQMFYWELDSTKQYLYSFDIYLAYACGHIPAYVFEVASLT